MQAIVHHPETIERLGGTHVLQALAHFALELLDDVCLLRLVGLGVLGYDLDRSAEGVDVVLVTTHTAQE